MIEIRHRDMTRASAVRDAYDSIYTERGINHRDSLYLWLIDLLEPEEGRLLLDISCGEGRLVELARRRGLRAVGVDFSPDAIHKAVERSACAIYAVGDGERLPIPSASVDYVAHIGSLEHYLHPIQGAREIARVLKPNGKACVLLPNTFGLLGNIRHVWKYGEVFDDGQPIQRYGTRRTWENLLSEAGLEVRRVLGYGEIEFPRVWRDVAALLRRPQRLLRALIVPFVPVNLANHFVFVCSLEAEG